MKNYRLFFTTASSVHAIRFLLPALGLALLSFTQAQGQIINFQFTDGYNLPVLNGETWSSTVSPLAYTGTTWSQGSTYGSMSSSDLPTSDNTPSTVGFTLTGDGIAFANDDGSVPLPMFFNTEYSTGDMTLTINGLQNGQAYNLYLASAFNGSDGSSYTIGTQTQNTTGASLSSFVSGVNYVEFAGVVAADNSISVTIAPNGTGQDLGILNGFQLQTVDVPEPSSMTLLGLGFGALVLFVARNRAVAFGK